MSTTAQIQKIVNWKLARNAGYARGYRAAMLDAAKLCQAESERVRAEDVGKMQRSHCSRANGARRCATILRALVVETPGVLNRMIEEGEC